MTSFSSAEAFADWRAESSDRPKPDYSPDPNALDNSAWSPKDPAEQIESPSSKILSRKKILENVWCQPRDRIEEAVCESDQSTLASLLNRKRDSWRSKLRKNARTERVTALHFAALFGEIEMGRRLISASFNVNKVPFRYSTNLTPLTFAIGARQVEMVEFLIVNGARPSAPDTWSALAGQSINRSWLAKTVSEVEKELFQIR